MSIGILYFLSTLFSFFTLRFIGQELTGKHRYTYTYALISITPVVNLIISLLGAWFFVGGIYYAATGANDEANDE